MNKELEVWKFAAAKLRRDEPVMLLAVAESSGSSPGRQGFKMIVSENDLAGSIGGGVMEVRLVEEAKLQITDYKFQNASEKSEIRNPKSKIQNLVHRKKAPEASGMICSGKQTVIFFELNSAHLKTVRQIIRALKSDRSLKLQISNFKFQISENQKEDFNFRFRRTGETEFFYEEKLGCKQRLFIVGGGHCALALSELMSKMDFHISLFDDREDLNTLSKNKFVHRKTIIDTYERIGDFIPSGADNYVVVMTLGFAFDEIVIRKLLDKDFKYFGVLGSKAKMKTLLGNLAREGFEKEKLARIRTPIGLPINSRTPEEIAVSIAAEIIAVKNSVLKTKSIK